MDKIYIGSKLREIRNDRDLTQDMVIKEVNERYNVKLSKGQLSKWENDKEQPTLTTTLVALIKYYNISLDYIIGLTDKKTPPHLR